MPRDLGSVLREGNVISSSGGSAGEDADRMARGEPVRLVGDVPVYASGHAPAYLRTATQLRRARLKLANGQLPLAYVVCHFFTGHRHDWEDRALYDPAAAVRMPPLGSATKRTMAARRTCPECQLVRDHIVRRGQCEVCRQRAEAAAKRERERTCDQCGATRRRPYPLVRVRYYRSRLCPACRAAVAAERREEAARWLARAITCDGQDCTAKVATKVEARAWRKANPGGYWVRRACPACTEQRARERAEAAAAAAAEAERQREERRQAVRDLAAWAAAALDDPSVAVLDTETTGLDSEACVVEIAVTTASGDVLLDTLVQPGVPIPDDATEIHGITDDMVASAPGFGEILVTLTGVLMGRRTLIYNASYDVARLRWELTRHYRAVGHADPAASAAAWLDSMTVEDVMVPYSDWVGDFSEYWGNYSWQPLNGGHRALGDCVAVGDRLREMAGRTSAVIPVPAADEPVTAAVGGWKVAG